jgi:small-conductance mechanosensitive channel
MRIKMEIKGILEQLITKFTTNTPRVASGLFVFLLFWLASAVLKVAVLRFGKKAKFSPDLLNFFARVTKATVLVIGGITALGTMGVNVSALVAGLGLLGFALGFALRDAVSNLLAGVLIIIYRPFQRDDRIAVAGQEGMVSEIDFRYTTLQGEHKKILIPNSALFTNTITVMEKNDEVEG